MIVQNKPSCVYLFVRDSLLLLGDFLIDIEDPRDVELHAVEVVTNHSPQLVQTRVTRLCDLRNTLQITFCRTFLIC